MRPLSFGHLVGEESNDQSKENRDEIDTLYRYFENLVQSGEYAPKDVGVLFAYGSQQDALHNRFRYYPSVTVESVDKLQGQERPCILYSCVRSSTSGA